MKILIFTENHHVAIVILSINNFLLLFYISKKSCVFVLHWFLNLKITSILHHFYFI